MLTPAEWLLSDDTGTSSKTICAVMIGARIEVRHWYEHDIPHDAGDFGRCYRLLLLFPEWRQRLPEVAQRFPKWGPMVQAWQELTALYERICEPDGTYTQASYERNKHAAKTLWDRMRSLADECRVADGWKQTGPGSWEKGERKRTALGNVSIEV